MCFPCLTLSRAGFSFVKAAANSLLHVETTGRQELSVELHTSAHRCKCKLLESYTKARQASKCKSYNL
jgi:hypothetical protein